MKHSTEKLESRLGIFLFLCAILPLTGCGYHVRSSSGKLPEGLQSIGVPVFKNNSAQFKLEQRLTSAVLKELSARTKAAVKSSSSDVDAVLVGEINSVSSSPVTFSSDTTFGSAFLITVQLSVKLLRTRDSAVIWEDGSLLYRERYVLNSKVADFFSEDNPALERLARDFAASLVSSLTGH